MNTPEIVGTGEFGTDISLGGWSFFKFRGDGDHPLEGAISTNWDMVLFRKQFVTYMQKLSNFFLRSFSVCSFTELSIAW